MIMDEAGIPCGPVMNVKEIIETPSDSGKRNDGSLRTPYSWRF